MRPTWLIEANVYGDEAGPLLAEIRRQGMTVEVVPHQAIRRGSVPVAGGRPLLPAACVLGYGSFPFARQIQLHHSWVPGAWCSATNLDCATYYAYLGRFLLNQHYIILAGVEAIRQRDWLYEALGADEVFARPTSCQKVFVGRRVRRDDFASALAPARYDPATLVVVAPIRAVGREWRLVVAGDQVVSGSQYAEGGERAITAGVPAEVRTFAEGVLAQVRWRPDPVFMLDVGEADGGLWVVELNGFSASWLYRCDVSAVVTAASREAEREWAARAAEPPAAPDTGRDGR
jgi:hypothetical protein